MGTPTPTSTEPAGAATLAALLYPLRERLAVALWFFVPVLFYAFYEVSGQTWWCLRFILPAFPALILSAMATLNYFIGSHRRWLFATAAAFSLWSLALSILWTREFHTLLTKTSEQAYADVGTWARTELPANTVILATGSLPDESGFQRWQPHLESLPGINLGNVWSPEQVLRREARIADSVVLYDEGSNWRGTGTAWALAEQGKAIVMISSELPEVLRMSHRILVMCEGRITGEVRGDEATQERLMELATQREALAA